MKTKILTDIGGVLIPDSFTKVTLMEDFERNGQRYVQNRIEGERASYGECAPLIGGVDVLVTEIREKAGIDRCKIEFEKTVVEYVLQQLKAKNKDPLFLDLMGRVNLAGLEEGRIKVDFYPDVSGALARWRYNRQKISTYSNGSSDFQRAMFKAANCGDISRDITEFFDTAVVGRKTEPGSYRNIAERLEVGPGEIEYFSDDTSELEAASNAGCRVHLVDRDNKHPELPRLAGLI